jgi:ribonuclease HII
VGVGVIFHDTIDSVNILEASRLAMRKAVRELAPPPDFVLIDGRMKLELSIRKLEIIRGDALSASIAAASIVAKVVRDRMMFAYHEFYPQFSFDSHKGYPTARHLRLLNQWGPCEIHRLSFKPVRERVEPEAEEKSALLVSKVEGIL